MTQELLLDERNSKEIKVGVASRTHGGKHGNTICVWKSTVMHTSVYP